MNVRQVLEALWKPPSLFSLDVHEAGKYTVMIVVGDKQYEVDTLILNDSDRILFIKSNGA